MNDKKLTAKQQKFIEEYLIDLNATQAAIRAGYSKRTAQQIGAENLSKPVIARAIEKAKKELSENTKMDAEFVRIRIGEMINADPCDIIDRKTGAYKSIFDWPIEWRRMLSAADVQELWEGRGKNCEKIGEIIKFKFIDKLRAIELLGKHTNVQAFSENINLRSNIGINIDGQDADL